MVGEKEREGGVVEFLNFFGGGERGEEGGKWDCLLGKLGRVHIYPGTALWIRIDGWDHGWDHGWAARWNERGEGGME